MIPNYYSCEEIPTELLQYNSCWDIHPFLNTTEPVSQSSSVITQVGLVKPPLVLAKKSGSYEFLSGWRSYNYLQNSHTRSTLWCRVLPEQTPQLSILAHLYLDYSSTRAISPIELAWFIAISRERVSSLDELLHLFKTLEMKSNKTHLERIERLLGLEPEMQRAMMEGTLNENIARDLLHFAANDRSAIFKLFSDLAMGVGKQRRLLALIRDLAGKKGISCISLIEEQEITCILEHPEMNIPQKSQALLNHLQNLLTPTLNTAVDSFNSWRNKLGLPENQSVGHSLNFEKDEILLSVRFQDREELEKHLPLIRSLSGNK